MQSQIDEYKLSPANEINLQNRLHQVDELQKNIIETRQIFSKYIENGREMCQNVSKLAKNFELCIGQDKSLTPIINILQKFESILEDHYTVIQSNIVDQIDKFISNDVKKAENDGKSAKHENSSFSKLLDSYVSVPIKKRSQNSAEFTELETKLIAQNWMAIKSNFSFARSLDLIERKSVLELTSYFILFARSLGYSFHNCAQVYNQSHDSFNIINQALPTTADELVKFQDRTSLLELTLQKVFNIYFKSFNPTSVYTSSNELSNEGFLWIRDQKWKKWKKRYCILKEGTLSAYKVAEGTNPNATYNLLLCSVKPIEDSERPSCFTIISTEFKQLVFQALTGYERDKWINIIQNNIEWMLNKPTTTASSSNNAEAQNQNMSTIARIMALPMNSICADCGARSPTWVCINWGNVICIHCSGVHRSLTSSVSKVKSTTLDIIDDVTIELFKIIGNLNVNKILEECLGANQNQNLNQQNQQQQNQQQQNQQQQNQQQQNQPAIQYQQQQNYQQQPNQMQQQQNYQQNQYLQNYQQSNQIPQQQQQNQYQQQPQQQQQNYQQNQIQQPYYQQDQYQQNYQQPNQYQPQPQQNYQQQQQQQQYQNQFQFRPQNQRIPNPSMIKRPMTQSPISPGMPMQQPNPSSITKITPEATKEARQVFITQKYKNLAFVKPVQVDIETAIRNSDIVTVFRSICTRQINNFQFAIHFAASVGDPIMCRLIALNVQNPDISNGGWTALSYAAYYGQIRAAQTLLSSGCSPSSCDAKSHPYRIAMLKKDEEMAAIFFPYWDKSQISGQLEEPPRKFI